MAKSIKIYLAGPEVFALDPIAQGTALKAHCHAHGAEGLFPLDNVLEDGHDLAQRIRDANMAMIRSCDALIANMEPFRGPSMDVGTAYEMGVAAALGKIVVGYSRDQRAYVDRVVEFGGGEEGSVKRGEDGLLRDANQMAVEEFVSTPLIDNLMMACGVDKLCQTAEEAVQAAVAICRTRNGS